MKISLSLVCLSLAFILKPVPSMAERLTNSAVIVGIKYHSTEHEVLAARGFTVIQTNPPGNCSWYWFNSDEVLGTALAVKAKISNLPINIMV